MAHITFMVSNNPTMFEFQDDTELESWLRDFADTVGSGLPGVWLQGESRLFWLPGTVAFNVTFDHPAANRDRLIRDLEDSTNQAADEDDQRQA